MKTIIRYAGGKSKAIKKITPYLVEDVIYSPFLGGGSIEVALASSGKKVIASDIFEVLVIFWKELLHNKDALVDELVKITPTKEEYNRIKECLIQTSQVQEMLKSHKTDFYKRTPISMSDVQLAAYYYFNHNVSYGPGFLGWPSSVYLKDKAWNNMIEKVKNFHCPNLEVKHQSFEKTIEDADGKMLYLDPPYYLSEDKDNKMFAGIYPMRNIPVHHNGFDHNTLANKLRNYSGKFVLSYNNCEWIKNNYEGFNFSFPEWHYSMGSGETRIGKNRTDTHVKSSHEIIITNF